MPLERKTFPVSGFAVDSDGPGRYGGHVAAFGNVDHGGDLIEHGATVAGLPNLVASGFLAWAHDYKSFPIGMIDEAREDAHGLWIAGPFHSTPDAQQARTIAAERLAAGKAMGMSIGYDPQEWTYRKIAGESGPYGADQIRVLTRIDVLEGSLVPLPMNDRAQLGEVKSFDVELDLKPFPNEHRCRLAPPGSFDRFRRINDAGRHDGKRIDHILGHPKGGGAWAIQSLALPTGEWGAADARAYCSTRDGAFEAAAPKAFDSDDLVDDLAAAEAELRLDLKEGRRHSAATLARIRGALEQVHQAVAELEQMIVDAEKPKSAGLSRHRFASERLLARLRREGLLTCPNSSN